MKGEGNAQNKELPWPISITYKENLKIGNINLFLGEVSRISGRRRGTVQKDVGQLNVLYTGRCLTVNGFS